MTFENNREMILVRFEAAVERGQTKEAQRKMAARRLHVSIKDCHDIPKMINLGGRYYLSMSKQTLAMNTNTMTTRPITA